MDSPEQKFFVSDDGKEKLSITKAELQAGIDSGKYGEKTLAWTKGMSGWLPLTDPSWEKHGIVIELQPPDLPNPIEDKTPQSAPNAQADSQPFLESKELPGTNPIAERQVPRSKLRFLKDALKAAWIIGSVYVGLFALKTLMEYAIGDLSLMEYAFGDSPNQVLEDAIADAWDWSRLQDRDGVMYLPNEEPFSGFAKSVYVNGQIKELAQFTDGKKNGLTTYWFENGQKRLERNYKDGKEDGLHTKWFRNGQKSSEVNYKDGWPDGLETYWYENGLKFAERNFKDGLLDGLETYWNRDGTITSRSSYKNGERVED